MIVLQGCDNTVIEDITEKIGSLSIIDVDISDPEEGMYDIELDDKRVGLLYKSNTLCIVRVVDDNNSLICPIDSLRFREVSIS